VELHSSEFVNTLLRSVSLPRTGSAAVLINLEALDSPKKTPEQIELLDQLTNCLNNSFPSVAPQAETLATNEKGVFINEVQSSVSSLISELGEPPNSKYSSLSYKLSSIQYNLSAINERINEELQPNEKFDEHFTSPASVVISLSEFLEANNLTQKFSQEIETRRSLANEIFSSDALDLNPNEEKNLRNLRKKERGKDRPRSGVVLRNLGRTALIIGLLSAVTHPPRPFDISSQWDGGKKGLIEKEVESSKRRNSIFARSEKSPAKVDSDYLRNRQETSPQYSENSGGSGSGKRIAEERNSQSNKSSSNPLSYFPYYLLLYYLLKRYVYRPLHEKYGGLIRGRNEVRHRQANSPFRGKPKEVLSGSIETNNAELKNRLWITSVWDPVHTSSFFRLDEDGSALKVKKGGLFSWIGIGLWDQSARRALQIRSIPQVPSNIITHVNEGSRTSLLNRIFFPRSSQKQQKIVWEPLIVPDLATLPPREDLHADVKYLIPKSPGRKTSLPVPAGYTIVGVEAPWNRYVERSVYGTWRVRVPLFFRGKISYRVAPGGEIIPSEIDLPFISKESQTMYPSMESHVLLLNTNDSNLPPPERVKEILEDQKSLGANLSYSPNIDHARSVKWTYAADILDSYPDHTPETLAFLTIHKARSIGIPSMLASGFRLLEEGNGSLSFLVSERSPSLIVPKSDEPSIKEFCEVDIYPTFDPPEDRKPQNVFKDLFAGINTFFSTPFGLERNFITGLKSNFEKNILNEPSSFNLGEISPELSISLIDPFHNGSLSDSALKVKVSLSRAIAENIKSSVMPTAEGNLTSKSIDKLVLENVQSLQKRVCEMAQAEPFKRWWSRDSSPTQTLKLLRGLTLPFEASENYSKYGPPLRTIEAAQVFFDIPEFTGCIETNKDYLGTLFLYLPFEEKKQLGSTVSKQQYFIERASSWLSTKVFNAYLPESLLRENQVRAMARNYLRPLSTWALRAIDNRHMSSTDGVKLFGDFASSLVSAYPALTPDIWKEEILLSLYEKDINEVCSVETLHEFLRGFSEHEIGRGLLTSAGSPSDIGMKLLHRTILEASLLDRTNTNSYAINSGILITKNFNLMGFDLGPLWEPAYETPLENIDYKLSRIFRDPIPDHTPPNYQLNFHGSDKPSDIVEVTFVPSSEYERSFVGGASLRLEEELKKGLLLPPPSISSNIEVREDKTFSSPVTFMPKTLNVFSIRKDGFVIGTLYIPESCVWELLFPKTSQAFPNLVTDSDENNLEMAKRWFQLERIKDHAAREILNLKTKELSRETLIELDWMFYLIAKEIYEDDSYEYIDFEKLLEFQKAWNQRENLREFNRLEIALLTLEEDSALEVRAIVGAWFELLTRNVVTDDTTGFRCLSTYMFASGPASYFGKFLSDKPDYYEPEEEEDGPFITYFENEAFLKNNLVPLVLDKILVTRMSSEHFLKMNGLGERVSPWSGYEFVELREPQSSFSHKELNAKATAKYGKPIINIRQNDEAASYLVWVDLNWLSEEVNNVSLGSNIPTLVTFIRSALFDQIPTTLELFIDGEVVTRMEARELINLLSSDDGTEEFVEIMGGYAQGVNLYMRNFGNKSSTEFKFPVSPIYGSDHTVLFSNSMGLMDLYRLLQTRTRSVTGCTVVNKGSLSERRFIVNREISEATL